MQKEVPSPLAGLYAAAQVEAERLQGEAPVKLWQPRPVHGRRRVALAVMLCGAVALAASALVWRTLEPAPVVAPPAAPLAALHPAGLWAVVEGAGPAAVVDDEPTATEVPTPAMPRAMAAAPASTRDAGPRAAGARVRAEDEAEEDDAAAQRESHD